VSAVNDGFKGKTEVPVRGSVEDMAKRYDGKHGVSGEVVVWGRAPRNGYLPRKVYTVSEVGGCVEDMWKQRSQGQDR